MDNSTTSFEIWKAELIKIAATETKHPESSIRINDYEAMQWYDAGWTPYYVFRECWDNDED